ncbi:hypothetical protein SH1V18_21640 [Vallitalea longa]|uniref:DUF1468 domain-containing protein n=1 Tax=Vallitalea longa TaxID=2936439 RepID=A0A9W5YAS6_9FIRM|nr:tripartite tricarboxylate transporter TctB family protein [Vallitalea longa]GKX29684.1 hypothetical protein SH1V18_21640 [Vallitalea longa]
MKKGNIVSGCIVIFIGVYVFFMTAGFPEGSNNVPGPAFFPRILAIIAIVLGAILVVQALINKADVEKINLHDENAKKSYITMGIIAIYLILFNKIGFLLLTPLLLFILIRFYGMKSIWKNAVISIMVTSVVYGVFVSLLSVPLPMGILMN